MRHRLFVERWSSRLPSDARASRYARLQLKRLGVFCETRRRVGGFLRVNHFVIP